MEHLNNFLKKIKGYLGSYMNCANKQKRGRLAVIQNNAVLIGNLRLMMPGVNSNHCILKLKNNIALGHKLQAVLAFL
jgi:hypothetical protein